MRWIYPLLFSLIAPPALAWEAGTDGPICTLSNSQDAGDVVITYDPRGPLYSITVTRAEPWPDEPVFGIAFQGGRELTITTDRHAFSEDGFAVSVSDRGFGNVLDGLAGNVTATAFAGRTGARFSLEGAAPEVEAFRACATAPSV